MNERIAKSKAEFKDYTLNENNDPTLKGRSSYSNKDELKYRKLYLVHVTLK